MFDNTVKAEFMTALNCSLCYVRELVKDALLVNCSTPRDDLILIFYWLRRNVYDELLPIIRVKILLQTLAQPVGPLKSKAASWVTTVWSKFVKNYHRIRQWKLIMQNTQSYC